ncbi:MAG: hypothetical protein Kow00120_06550 [Anaerolineae bacterium]
MRDQIDPIEPEAARPILEEALEPYLEDEWFLIDRDDYSANLTKGSRNVYIRVDWLGQVQVEETPLRATQTTGRLVAWMLLIAALLVTLALASALGLLR